VEEGPQVVSLVVRGVQSPQMQKKKGQVLGCLEEVEGQQAGGGGGNGFADQTFHTSRYRKHSH
jgi:hypothetical protein